MIIIKKKKKLFKQGTKKMIIANLDSKKSLFPEKHDKVKSQLYIILLISKQDV
jgi:hypothetical protein